MKRSGQILTFNGQVAPALNVFAQLAIPTGLVPGGLEALLMIGLQYEYSQGVDNGALRETAICRASKAAMPALLDDDVMVKTAERALITTSGATYQNSAPIVQLPPNSIIVVESNFYLQYKQTSQVSNSSCSMLAYFERVTLTEAEKNSILSARLNNLLS